MTTQNWKLLTLLSLTLSAVACSGDKDEETGGAEGGEGTDGGDGADGTDGSDGTDGGDTGSTEPSVTITSPTPGEEVEDSLTLTYTVANFALDEGAAGSANEEGHGHVHIYLNGEYFDFDGEGSYDFVDLPAGEHNLELRLANHDHTELPYTASVDFVATGTTSPFVAITSPAFGSEINASSLELGLTILNHTISEDVGGEPVLGEGHYHIFVDGAYYDYGTDADSAWVADLTPGEHQISVELVGNDHSSYDPPISDTVEVVVPEGTAGISISTPSMDEVIQSSSWYVEWEVWNFLSSSEGFGGAHVDGEGHFHVYLNGEYHSATADFGMWLTDLPAGRHDIEVRLAGNDHSELGSIDYVRGASLGDRPGITLTSPPSGEIVGSNFNVQVAVENFSLVDFASHSGAVSGEGHYHVYIDGDYQNACFLTTCALTGISPGEHELSVRLVNNDHSDVNPMVLDLATISVE